MRSQLPAEPRHTTLVAWKVLAGQLDPLPVQFSAMSQTSVAARQGIVDG